MYFGCCLLYLLAMIIYIIQNNILVVSEKMNSVLYFQNWNDYSLFLDEMCITKESSVYVIKITFPCVVQLKVYVRV